MSPRLLVRVSILTAAIFAVGFWYARFDLARMQSDWAKTYRDGNRPLPLNGLRFNLQEYVGGSHHVSRHALLLVLSDSCPSCQRTLPQWIHLINSLPWGADDEVVVLTIHGFSLANALTDVARARGVRSVSADISHLKAKLAAQTGIVWTPETMWLDGQQQIRLAVDRVDPGVETEFVRLLGGGGKP